jgi:hypothetical protein
MNCLRNSLDLLTQEDKSRLQSRLIPNITVLDYNSLLIVSEMDNVKWKNLVFLEHE